MKNEHLVATYICSNSKLPSAIKKKTYCVYFADNRLYLVCGDIVCKKCFRIKGPVRYEQTVTIHSNNGHTVDIYNAKCCVVCKTNILYHIAVSGLWKELRSWSMRRNGMYYMGSPSWQQRIRYKYQYGYRYVDIQEIKGKASLGL
jgi:hypothetical protein